MKRSKTLRILIAVTASILLLISAPLSVWGLQTVTLPTDITLIQVSPSAPSGLKAELSSDMKVKLTWTDNSLNETGFVIQRRVYGTSYAGDLVTVAANQTTYYDQLNVNFGMFGTAYYQIRAINSVGSSSYSNEASVDIEQPYPPQALQLVPGYTGGKISLSLTWLSSSPSITDYFVIHRSTDSGAYEIIGKTDKTNYTDTELEDSTEYSYMIEAIGYFGASMSNPESYTTPDSAPVSTLTGPAVQSGGPDFSGASDWAKPELQEAYDLDLTTDTILSNYSKNITREEFCEIAVKLYEALSGKSALTAIDNPFSDTTNTTVLKAFNLGIIKGTSDTTFSPKNSITRQEICVMIYRTLKAADPDIDANSSGVSAFTDESSIAPWAIDAVRFASKNGIMKGTGGGNINPLNNTSREQAIVLLKRTFDSFE